MVDSPREVIGAVLKYMGASYNTKDINLDVNGGRDAVKLNLSLLAKQVLSYAVQISNKKKQFFFFLFAEQITSLSYYF